ncbi:MAG: acetyltransferase [Odoribacter sp.]|nr:acetyltransferase [Odoribacter sp.]
MKPIILIGGGGHCISCIDVIEQTGLYHILGIFDLPEKLGQKLLNYSIIGTDNELEQFVPDCPDFLITVGQIKSSVLRETIFNKVKQAGGKLPVIISPLAYVSSNANIGEGSIIMHHALVNAGATIRKGCIINTKTLIEHEATVGNFCHISTASVVNGQANIGDCCFIGSNTVIANNTNVIANTIIAAGSQVLRNIEIAGTYIGHPLRKIR